MKKFSKSFLFIWIVLIAFGCSKQIYTADIDTANYRVGKWHKSDGEIDDMIQPYKVQLDAQMNEIIATNPEEMRKERPNSSLGNWFSDALLESAIKIYNRDIDIAMQNYGGIRVPSLGAGSVTVGNIYELMPFDNKLVLLTLEGPILQQLLDRVAEKGGWPISSTLAFTIDNDKATNIKIKGKDFDIGKAYTVALADYIADGGDSCFFLSDAEREDKDLMIRDIIIDHLRGKKNKIISVDSAPRIASYKR